MEAFFASLNANFLNSLFRFATPVLLAALGGILCARVGVFNIALEGMMLTGAFTAVAGEYYSGDPWIGVLSGCLGAAVLALIYAILVITLKGNEVVVGIATNLFASGLTTFLLPAMFHVKGKFFDPRLVGLSNIKIPVLHELPFLGPLLSGQTVLVYLTWLLYILAGIMLFRTALGLRLRGVGEQPLAAATLGVKVNAFRYMAVLLSGIFCGLAGAQLSVGIVNVFVQDMAAGRGWIAVVAVLLGQANPLGVFITGVFFGLADSLSLQLQGVGLAPQFTEMLPYLVTLLVFGLVRARQKHPRSALAN